MAEDLNGVKADLYRAFNKAMKRVDVLDPQWNGSDLAHAVSAAARAGEALLKIEETLMERDSLRKSPGLTGQKP